MQISKAASKYCETLRGGKTSYTGCGSDSEFCNLCRNQVLTLDQLEANNAAINKFVENVNRNDTTN